MASSNFCDDGYYGAYLTPYLLELQGKAIGAFNNLICKESKIIYMYIFDLHKRSVDVHCKANTRPQTNLRDEHGREKNTVLRLFVQDA